jgi:hypothetical protein
MVLSIVSGIECKIGRVHTLSLVIGGQSGRNSCPASGCKIAQLNLPYGIKKKQEKTAREEYPVLKSEVFLWERIQIVV